MSVVVPISLSRTLRDSSADLAAVVIEHCSGSSIVVLVFSQSSASDDEIARAVPFAEPRVITWASISERQQWLAEVGREVEDHAARQYVADLVVNESTRHLFLVDSPWPQEGTASSPSSVHVVVRDATKHEVQFGERIQLDGVCAEPIVLTTALTCSSKLNVLIADDKPLPPLVDTFEPIRLEPSETSESCSMKIYAAIFARRNVAVDVIKLVNAARRRHADGKGSSTVSLFWPPEIFIPVLVEDAAASNSREKLHHALMLPHRKAFPQFLALDLQNGPLAPWTFDVARLGQPWEGHLVCMPHSQVVAKKLAIAGSTTSIVQGKYDYYHYQVDGFSDNGWGCAYRSMQTVLSWFQHQMFVRNNMPMPSIKQIQQILAAVDPDKQSKPRFVGSSDWIGSFEVMLVLQHFVPDLECRIQRLEQGIELETSPQIHRTLQAHFLRGGPPVMIGGSSYAHTILGIDVNIKTSEAQYLVLDPHYGATTTNMKTVVQKGWCGWKVARDFFKPDSWYNLCIPSCYSVSSPS